MKSIIYFLGFGLGFLCGCTEGIPDAGSSGGAASFVPYTGTTTDPALLYNRRFALEDIREFETLPERLPAEFFDINTRYWPTVTDKAYKQAIFEAVKEVIAFVDYLPQSGYDFKRTWGDFNGFSTRFDNWEDWLEDVYRDYDPSDGFEWPDEQGRPCYTWISYTHRVLHPFMNNIGMIGLSLEGTLPPAYQSLLFCETMSTYFFGIGPFKGYFPYVYKQNSFGWPTIIQFSDPVENHELYVSNCLCCFQRLYNAFRNKPDEELREEIDDAFSYMGAELMIHCYATFSEI
jgi:hypothetical protein